VYFKKQFLAAIFRISSISFLVSCMTFAYAATLEIGKTSAAEEEAPINLSVQDIERFAGVVGQVHRYYVEPVKDKKLFNYAVAGMLSNLDPHSEYLDEEALEDLKTTTTGKFGGIGVEILPSDGFIKIISPIDGTPAYKAGIKAGDLIVRIDNKLIRDMTLHQAINMIRGDSGSKVHLTILRKDEKKPLEFDVEREIIKVQTVKTELLPGGYGYVRLAFFQDTTRTDVLKAIKKLQKEASTPLKGVILDLRNNPGGLLDAAIDVTELFLDSAHLKYKGLIVYTKGRIPSSDIKATAAGQDILQGIPLIVLINEGSASAAEIMAGALQDQHRATLVGQKSFGKGSVQTILGIDEKSAIKLTTAFYYTPAGRMIQATGIEPDIEIPDMHIPKATSEDSELLSVSEKDLEKHLPNAYAKEDSAQDKKTAQELDKKNKAQKIQALLYSDFQLYQALNILQGLRMSMSP
jgi:carboxyl-terminal processing protease